MASQLCIKHVIASAGAGAFFFDDQAAIKAGAQRDGAAYLGKPVTPGYGAVREPAESVSVMLVLEDGYVALGDCASVQYSGVGGREPRLHAAALAAQIERQFAPRLLGLPVANFRAAVAEAEALIQTTLPAPCAAAYGVSQALLDAAAHAAGHHLPARVIQDEWTLKRPLAAVPIYGQSGEARHDNVDKMIVKRVPVLPHGLINTPELVGPNGAALVQYLVWIGERIKQLCAAPGGRHYQPIIHLDVYGMIGVCAQGDISKTADIIMRLEAAAAPLLLRIEHPIHADSRDAQIRVMVKLRNALAQRGSRVQLIADEWANTLADIQCFAKAGAADLIQIKTPDLGALTHTVAAVLACQHHGVGPVLGGTCAETDVSARATVHVGIATGVAQLLAKPGMGFDEGFSIVANEMQRALRLDAMLPGRGDTQV